MSGVFHLPYLESSPPGQIATGPFLEPFPPGQLTAVLPGNLPLLPKNIVPPPPASPPPSLHTESRPGSPTLNTNKATAVSSSGTNGVRSLASSTVRRQLEVQFILLKNSLSATSDYALAALEQIEGAASEVRFQSLGAGASQKTLEVSSTPASDGQAHTKVVPGEPCSLHVPGVSENHLSVADESPTLGVPAHPPHGTHQAASHSAKHVVHPTFSESHRDKDSHVPQALPTVSESRASLALGGITRASLAQPGRMSHRRTDQHPSSKVPQRDLKSHAVFDPVTATAVEEEIAQFKDRPRLQRQGEKGSRFMSFFRQEGKMPTRVFADADMMKDRVRQAMTNPVYNVCDKYKKTGICQRIARSSTFENFTLLVIGLNSLWIGVEADLNDEVVLMRAPWPFQFGENAFCTYFFIEVIIRFCSFDGKLHAFRDPWFVFDSTLAFMMVVETWGMSFFFLVSADNTDNPFGDAGILRLMRLLRLSRMARMYRLLRALPEVMILIKGMWVATRSVVFTLILLLVVIYIFAVAFAQLTADLPVGNAFFPSVIAAMKTLLLNGTFMENIPDVYYACAAENELLGLLLLLYVLVGSLTVMNMLVGVLVEVVSVVAAVEKETLETTYVKQYLENLFIESGMDVQGNKMMNRDGFEMLLAHPDACSCLHSVGVDVVGLVDVADFILRGEDISFIDFVDLVLSLRGSNVARVKDIVDLRTYLTMELEQKAQIRDEANNERLARIEEAMHGRLHSEESRSIDLHMSKCSTFQASCQLGQDRTSSANTWQPSYHSGSA